MTASSALFLLDALLVALFWPLTAWLSMNGVPPEAWVPQAVILVISNLAFLYALGLYRRDAIIDTGKSLGRIPVTVAISIIVSSLVIGVLSKILSLELVGPQLGRIFAAAMGCFTICALIARIIFRVLRRHPMFHTRLLVIGAGARAWDLLWILRSQGRNLHYDVTFVHDESFGPVDSRLSSDPAIHIVPYSGKLIDIADRFRSDEIVVAPDERRGMALEALITCKTAGYPVLQYMSFLENEVRRIDIKRLDLTWLLFSEGFYSRPIDRVVKRGLDITLSLFILVLTFPFLLIAMLLIWLGDRGSVFYRQKRVTLEGRTFQILKLRTMRMNAESGGAVWAATNDNRIARVGSFLRQSRLDELPQLFNVLSGDMSLVGPRPERPEFVAELTTQLPLYQERHAVKAGLTGWAQVNYPYGASLDDARSKLSYDLYYVKNCNPVFDLLILIQTLRVVIWPGSGAR